MAQPALRQAPVPIVYPERDGKPMAETDTHRKEIIHLIEALRVHFRTATDIYISGDLLLYYEEGNPKARRAPDVFVVKGVANHERRIYKLWEEKQVPALVIEVTSKSTRQEDLVQKRELYASIGVEEYFLHDPLDEYLDPPFQGYRLRRGVYRPISQDPDGGYTSRTLGLRLRRDGKRLRWIDTIGEPLPDALELDDARQDAENAHGLAVGARILEAKARKAAEQERDAAQRACVLETKARREAERQAAAAKAELARLRALIEH